jgi:ribose 5-phosphate isomerase B
MEVIMMKIAIGTDPMGFKLKEAIKRHLLSLGHEVEDFGQLNENKKVLFWEAASSVARAVQEGKCDRGILCCATGAGVSIVANKFKGVWAVACESIFTGERCAIINNANVITLGSQVVGEGNACRIVENWLSKKFTEGLGPDVRERILNGLNKLKEIEAQNFQK